MGLVVLRPHVHHYHEMFSPRKAATSITEYKFPVGPRAAAVKCDGKTYLQAGSRCPVIHYGENQAVVENKTALTPHHIRYYSTPQGVVDLNKEGILLAIDRRIALFFQMAILCYRMSMFTFSAKGADAQIGSSGTLKLSGPDGKHVEHKREAAHSSTIPTLRARLGNGQEFVYLKGGSSYAQHNATIGAHVDVNGADEIIDGKGGDGRLRDEAVRILNLTAKGLDPKEATLEFLRSFDAQLDRDIPALKRKEKPFIPDGRRLVLEVYQRAVRDIQEEAESPIFFDRLLGVKINEDDPDEDALRDIVYKKRYDLIRLQEVVESRIGKRLADFQNGMASKDRSLLEFIVLKDFAGTPQQRIVSKLFAKTAAVLEPLNAVDRGHKTFITRVNNLRTKHKVALADLRRNLQIDFRELSAAEFAFRAGVFRDLRTKVREWRQVDFCNHYEETTGHKVSQAWVSRMEQLARVNTKLVYKTPITQRRRYVTIEEAQRCADTFGVDLGIFMSTFWWQW